MPRFHAKRFEELVLYIAERTADDPKFGHTKLAKALFYSDFDAYRVLGEPITGARYEKWDHGPYPPNLGRTVEKLEREGKLVVRHPKQEYEARRLIPTERGHADLKSVGIRPEQIEIVDEWIGAIRRATSVRIKNYSHQFAGYAMVERNDEIPYDTTFLANRPPKTQDVDRARQIAVKRGWLVEGKWQRN